MTSPGGDALTIKVAVQGGQAARSDLLRTQQAYQAIAAAATTAGRQTSTAMGSAQTATTGALGRTNTALETTHRNLTGLGTAATAGTGAVTTALRNAQGRFTAAGNNLGAAAGTGITSGVRDNTDVAGAAAQATSGGGGESKLKGIASKLGGKMGAWIAGGLAGAGIGEALGEAFDWQGANAKTSAKLALSPADAKAAGAAAGKLYVNGMAESAESSNDIVQSVLRDIGKDALNNTDRTLSDVGAKAAAIADAFGHDTSEVTIAAGQLLKTKLAPDVNSALDMITAGFQKGNDKAGDYLDTLNEYPVQFQKAGINGKIAMGLVTQALQGGATNSDLVADSVKEIGINLLDSGSNAAVGLKMLGLNAKDVMGQYRKGGDDATAAMQKIFDRVHELGGANKNMGALANIASSQIEDMGSSFDKLDTKTAAKSIGEVGGATQKLSDTMYSTVTSSMTTFWRTIKMQVVDFLLDKVVPALTSVAMWLGSHVGPAFAAVGKWIKTELMPWLQQVGQFLSANFLPILKEAWSWLSDRLGPAFGKVGDWIKTSFLPWLKEVPTWYRQNKQWLDPLLVGLGAMLVVGGAISVGMRVWGAVTRGYAAAMGLLTLVMEANPFVKVALLLAGLAAGLVYAYKHSEKFREIVDKVFHVVAEAGRWMWEKVLKPTFEFLSTAWQGLVDGLKIAWDQFGAPVWTAVSGAVQAMWDLVDPIFTWISANWSLIWNAVKIVWDVTGAPIFTALSTVFGTLNDTIIQPLWKAITGVWDKISGFFGALAQPVKDAVTTVKGALDDIWGAVTGFFNKEPGTFNKGPSITDMLRGAKSGSDAGSANAAENGGSQAPVVSGRGQSMFADGGLINPSLGGPRQDNVPIWASGGEYMINAKSTSQYLPLLQHINADKYADGGWVRGGAAAAKKINDIIAGKVGRSVNTNSFATQAGITADGLSYSQAAMAPAAGSPVAYTGGAGVEQWRGIALQALALTGQSAANIDSLMRRMNQESSGNPNAINLTDSNARRGTPSKGLMQTIDSTFAENALPGYGSNVYDPLSNIIASIRYAIKAYGSLPAAYDRAGGYDSGGMLYPGQLAKNNLRVPERVLNPEQWSIAKRAIDQSTNSRITIESGAVQINIPAGSPVDAQAVADAVEDSLYRILREKDERKMARSR